MVRMKTDFKFLLITILAGMLMLPGLDLIGQSVPMGMNYQAVARDAQGMPIANQGVYLRISLTSADEVPEVYYQEIHEARTDELGLFDLVIGKGDASGKTLKDVPWAKGDIWLSIELATDANPQYQLVSNTMMMAVPMAMHAETADEIVDEEVLLRNQSIYWNTSGNRDSRPDFHFLGTRDAKDFVIKTNDEERARFTGAGQLQITAGPLDGRRSDTSPDSYPVVIDGAENNQGIFIKIDESRSESNNFVTFADSSTKGIQGAIEGQTYLERTTSKDYIIEAALFAIKIASTGVQIGSSSLEFSALVATVIAVPAGVMEALDLAGRITKVAGLAGALASWIAKNIVCTGVNYRSGGADYAEYLLRDARSRDLQPTEIVGVKGGKVSLETEDADHIMVVSTNPIVVGNMPPENIEPLYEKVAFMGQVPVQVAGPVSVGDYILPSGNNDGMGIAVSPEDMKFGDYPRIVGVSWENGEHELVNIVNVAVGINSEDMSQRVDLLNRRVDNIMNFLEGKEPLITDPALLEQTKIKDQEITSVQKILSDDEFMAVIEEHSDAMIEVFDEAKKIMASQDFDYTQFPGLEKLFDDPVTVLKELRTSPDYITQWSFADKKLLEILENK